MVKVPLKLIQVNSLSSQVEASNNSNNVRVEPTKEEIKTVSIISSEGA